MITLEGVEGEGRLVGEVVEGGRVGRVDTAVVLTAPLAHQHQEDTDGSN